MISHRKARGEEANRKFDNNNSIEEAYDPPVFSFLVRALFASPHSLPSPSFFPHPWLCLRKSAFFSLFFSSTFHRHIDELNTKSNDSTRLNKKRRTMYHPTSHTFIISKEKQRGKGQGPRYKRLNAGSHTSRLPTCTLTPFPSQAQ